MTPVERVRSILRDYFELIRVGLSQEEYAALARLQDRELVDFVAEKSRSPAIIVEPTHRSPRFDQTPSGVLIPSAPVRNAFEVRFDNLIRDIGAYWDEHGLSLLKALTEDNAYSIVLPMRGRITVDLSATVCRLGVYFDSILIVDPVYIPRERREQVIAGSEFPASRLAFAQRLGYLLRLESLLSDATDKNIFVIVPDFICTEADIDDTFNFLGQLFGPEVSEKDITGYIGYCAGLVKDAVPMLPIQNQELWTLLLDRFRSPVEGSATEIRLFTDIATTRGSIRSSTRDMHNWPVEDALDALWRDVDDCFYILRETIGNASLLDADPIIYGPDNFMANWYRKVLAQGGQNSPERSREAQGVSQALLHERTDFLEALSLKDLQRVRADGVFEELRRQLRLDRAQMRQTGFSTTEQCEKAFLDHFFVILEEFGHGLDSLSTQHRQRLRRCWGGVGVSVAMGALGFLVPPVVILQALTTVTGVTIGGSSVLDLVTLRRSHTKEQETARNSPIGLLYDAWSRRVPE